MRRVGRSVGKKDDIIRADMAMAEIEMVHVREVLCMDGTARTSTGAWQLVITLLASIFVVLIRLVVDILICGVSFLNRHREMVDLRNVGSD